MADGPRYTSTTPNEGYTKRAEFADKVTDPSKLSYTPTTAGNWPVAPTSVKDALDKLAARVKALEP